MSVADDGLVNTQCTCVLAPNVWCPVHQPAQAGQWQHAHPIYARTITEPPPTLEPQSDVNVGGPDGSGLTVGTVVLPYYGDEARRQLWRRLDHVRRQHMAQWEPVTITLPRELAQIAANACRARGRSRAEAALRAALEADA